MEPEVTLRFLNREHGRGLTMARNAFDSVEFNAKGNQVTLTKRHSISGAKAG
jgi:anti-sigma regulatory factor (Ser/Thr protein kinase)